MGAHGGIGEILKMIDFCLKEGFTCSMLNSINKKLIEAQKSGEAEM